MGRSKRNLVHEMYMNNGNGESLITVVLVSGAGSQQTSSWYRDVVMNGSWEII